MLHMAPLQALISTTIFLLLLAASPLAVGGGSSEEAAPPSSAAVYRLELIHVDADGNFTRDELIRRARHRSRVRAAALSLSESAAVDDSRSSDATAAADDGTTTYLGTAIYNESEYLMQLRIGTSKQIFSAVADTGSDVIWTRKMGLCDAIKKCLTTTTPSEPCVVFSKVYGSSKISVKGFMADEVLTLSSCSSRTAAGPGKEEEGKKAAGSCSHKAHIGLGCVNNCNHCDKLLPESADGIVGLNQGPGSLVDLVKNQLKVTRFSYCLSSRLMPELGSPLWFGGANLRLQQHGDGSQSGAVAVQTTPLVTIPMKKHYASVWANRYYVELEGISISSKDASRLVEIPKEAFNHRSVNNLKGVMFVDSGCSYSHLEAAAFNVVKNLLAEQLKTKPFLNDDNMTCFDTKHATGSSRDGHDPDIVLNLHLTAPPSKEKNLHLTPAKMPLRWSSYMENGCLTIENSGQEISILGNFQQQNIHMLYDLDGEKQLSFVQVEDCSQQQMD